MTNNTSEICVGFYRIEIIFIVSGNIVNRCHVSRLFIPLAVEIVSHDGYPIEFFGKQRYIVTLRDETSE